MTEDIKFLDEIINLKDRKKLMEKRFFWIYPFTNENIKAYYSYIDFNQKDVLCVTSSGDHALNAILNGAKNISCFDINPLAKYYSELKIAAIKSLSLEEFILFFYDKKLSTYKYFMNKNIYNKIKNNLSGEYKEFWDYFFEKVTKMQIFKSHLFSDDYLTLKALVEVNCYLNEESYYKLRDLLNENKITYYDISIEELKNINNKFDIILLSNVPTFLDYMYDKDILINFKESLNVVSKDNTRVVINYFYDNLINYGYSESIYDKNLISEFFNKNEYEYKSFESSYNFQLFKCLRKLTLNYDKILITKEKK